MPRNLAAGSHTPLQPTSSRRGLPRGRPSCVFPSFFAPTPVVLAHAGTHLLPTISHPNIIPNAAKPCREISPLGHTLLSNLLLPVGASLVGARLVFSRHSSPPLPLSSRMRGPTQTSFQTQRSGAEKSRRWVTHKHLQPTSSRRGLPRERPSCVFPSFFAHTPVVLAHAGTHLLPTISHPNIIPNAAKPCRGISPLGHTLLSNLLLPVGESLVGACLVFSHHSSPPLPLSSRMRGPIFSPPFPTQTSFRAAKPCRGISSS